MKICNKINPDAHDQDAEVSQLLQIHVGFYGGVVHSQTRWPHLVVFFANSQILTEQHFNQKSFVLIHCINKYLHSSMYAEPDFQTVRFM